MLTIINHHKLLETSMNHRQSSTNFNHHLVNSSPVLTIINQHLFDHYESPINRHSILQVASSEWFLQAMLRSRWPGMGVVGCRGEATISKRRQEWSIMVNDDGLLMLITVY